MSDEKKTHKIELELTAAGFGSKVRIDGQEIPYVTRVRVNAEPKKDATRLELDIVAIDGVTVTGELPIFELAPETAAEADDAAFDTWFTEHSNFLMGEDVPLKQIAWAAFQFGRDSALGMIQDAIRRRR